MSERQVLTALLDHYYVRASCCASFLFHEEINQLILYKRASRGNLEINMNYPYSSKEGKATKAKQDFFLSYSYTLHLREGFVSYLIFLSHSASPSNLAWSWERNHRAIPLDPQLKFAGICTKSLGDPLKGCGRDWERCIRGPQVGLHASLLFTLLDFQQGNKKLPF